MSSSLPGLVLTTAIAIAADQLHGLSGLPIDSMMIAIVLGMLIRNTLGLSARFVPGVRTSVMTLTSIGIVLMGAKLDFHVMARTSTAALLISVVCVVVALTLTIALCRRLGVTEKLGTLIGIGTAICGSSAIAVAAPVIEADERDTAFAIATVTLFGMIAVFLLPVLGHLIGLDDAEFGVWAGTSIHAVPQVVAAGFAYSPEAGEIATIVKLARVLLLAPVVIGLAVWYGRKRRAEQIAHVTRIGSLKTLVPPFIVGFLGLAIASTLHLLPNFTLHLEESILWAAGDRRVVLAELVTKTSTFLLTISMAGVGLGVDLRGLARIGLGALYVGLASAVVLAGFSLLLLRVLL